jgi:glutathione S-transferase/GST-like protein
MLSLYHWEPNANSGKPMLAALEKGVAFESHYLDMLNFDHHTAEYRQVNPHCTLPSMVHDGVLVPESTAMMEYIDATFDGPPLRPADPFERWRMRWWCRFYDQYLGPSYSMLGWSFFVGPALRHRDPEALRAHIARIPLRERQIAWSKAIFGTFSAAELAESQRRIEFSAVQIEQALRQRPWLAGQSYSIADMVGFNMSAGLPAIQPAAFNDQRTPHVMQWLRRIYQRPAVRTLLSMARQERMRSYPFLERQPS